MKSAPSFIFRRMNVLRTSRLWCLSLVLVNSALIGACSSDSKPVVAPVERSLNGNWGSPHFSYASFALTEAGGIVTGHGWYTLSGSPLIVEGTHVGERVALNLFSRRFPSAVVAHFNGVFLNDALVGDLEGTRLSLARVDSVSKSYIETFSPSLNRQVIGNATFARSTEGTSFFFSSLALPDFSLASKLSTIAPGKYAIGPNRDFFSYYATDDGPVGELTITTVASKMIAGSFSLNYVINGVPGTVTGTFDASCPFDDVPPIGLRCTPTK